MNQVIQPPIPTPLTPPIDPNQDRAKQLEEIVRCKSDPIYFMLNYVYIRRPGRGGGRIRFKMYDFQKESVMNFLKHRKVIILKSRQLGISWTYAAYVAWKILFHEAQDVLLVAQNGSVATNLMGRIKFIMKYLPKWMIPENKKVMPVDNRQSIELFNDSKVMATTTTANSGVGESLSLLIIDEAAVIPHAKAKDLWTAIEPTIEVGGDVIIVSCVTKDTMVITDKGIQEIGDFVDYSKDARNGKGYKVKKYGVLGKDRIRSGNIFYNNGKHPTRRIKTKFSELECTRTHKLWAYSHKNKKYDWIKSENLEVGDFVSLQFGKRLWGNQDDVSDFIPSTSLKIHSPFSPKSLTPDLCYLLGLYIAEGSAYKVFGVEGNLRGASITITCGDDISHVIDSVGLNYSCHDGIHYTVSNKNLVEFMEYLGFDLSLKASEKRIPSRLLQVSEECIRALVQGIFDGDGCSMKKAIKLTSTSKKLIDQVRMILSNFGVLASLTGEKKDKMNLRNLKIKHNHDVFNLEMSGKNALRYYDRIGFRFDRKQINRKSLVESNLFRSTSHDVIPNSLHLVKELVEVSGKTFYGIKKEHDISVHHWCCSKSKYKTDNISRENVLYLYSLFGEMLPQESQEYWNRILSDDIEWCPITFIEESENETFDFSLPEEDDFWCHSVIYNGVIGHQTPREVGAWFHEMWVDACKDRKTSKVTGEKTTGKNGFFPMILGWEVLPDRTQEWAKRKISEIGTQRFRREYACQFIGHGSTLIEYDIIDQMEKLYCVAPIRHETNPLYPDSPIKIWKDPEPGSKYVMFIDTSRSEAEGGDDQAFSIFEFPDASGEDDAFVKYEQVVEFNGKMLLNDYSEVLYEFAVAYNKAFVVCEKNAMGIKIATDFSAEYYPFIWYDMEPQSKMNRSAKQRYKKEPGLDTTTRTRDLYVKLLYNDFMKQKIVIRGRTSYEQLRHFVWNAKKRRYEAMSGKHDDLVMVLGMAAYVWYNATHFDRGNRLILDFIRSGGLKYTHSGKKKGNYDIPIMVHRSTSKKMGNPNDPIHIQQNDFGWLFGGSAKWYKQRDD